MDQKSERPGAGGAGPRDGVFARGRNEAEYNSCGLIGQRTRADELERVRSALTYIDPHNHDTWLKVGMAIKDEYGDDGWPIFDEWSRPVENYDARENRRRWQSFKRGGGVTIASVYGLARDAGWRDDGTYRVPDQEELARRRSERSKAEAEAAVKRDLPTAEATRKAQAIWSNARPAPADNPYCRRKGITPTETLRGIDAANMAAVLGYVPSARGVRLEGPCLVVPIKVRDKLASLQLIDGAGSKHFLAGGTIGRGYWAARALPDGDGTDLVLLIGEGVATVLSAIQAMPGALGIAAMSNSNIPSVARQFGERYPRADIMILADIDKATGEPDKHAVAAATVGGRLAVPQFADGPATDRTDFNDLTRIHGAEFVREIIEAAVVPLQKAASSLRKAPGKKVEPKVELVAASTIKPEPVRWLWNGYLARGKVHMLGGKPAAGKTTLALAMAATVTTGGKWPDGTQCERGAAVIWSGEDDPKDTLVPRLIAAGADRNRVYFVGKADLGGESVPFDPAVHLPVLAEALAQQGDVALLILDPVVSVVAGDSNKNAEVRRALQPLADLAAASGCAVLGITHFTKGTGGRDPVERLTGSLAFGAVARIALVAAKAEDVAEGDSAGSKPARLLLRAKSNIGPDGGGFAYDLEERALAEHPSIITSALRWGQAVQGTARELLAQAEATDGEGAGAISEAEDWLRELLVGGPVETNQIKSKATALGLGWATIRRAEKILGVEKRKQGLKGGWTWELPRRCSPHTEDAQQKAVSTFADFEHLRAGDTADVDPSDDTR